MFMLKKYILTVETHMVQVQIPAAKTAIIEDPSVL